MFNELKEKIKKDKPFLDLINIRSVKKMPSYGDLKRRFLSYGVNVRIRDSNGKFYKLKVSPSIRIAKKYERIINLVPHILPKFYGRDRNYLLSEFLDGRTLTKDESLDIFFEAGKMCGEISKYKAEPNKKKEFENINCKIIKSLLKKQVISSKDYQKILKSYEYLAQKIEYDVVLAPLDIKLSNFMLDSQNKLYFVDEDGIDYNINGVWLDYLKFDKKQNKAFLKGYHSVSPLRFFNNKEYLRLAIFISSLHMLDFFLRLGEETTEYFNYELRHLLKIAKIGKL
ncbi:MAG: hypothetical protein JRI96_14530 [Deltaproteobacteria bacterium]|nr:hypothetical protein [Deltaproteobacteria bacterium]